MWASDCQRERAYEEMTHSYSTLSQNLSLAAPCSIPALSPLRRKTHIYNVFFFFLKKVVTTFIITNSRIVISPANVIIHRSLHHWVPFLFLSCLKIKMVSLVTKHLYHGFCYALEEEKDLCA